MKKTIADMSTEELGKVFDSNERLRSNVQEDSLECEMIHIEEMLEGIVETLSRWSIGAGQKCFMTVNTNYLQDFIESVRDSQKSYGMLMDKDVRLIDHADDLLDKANNIGDWSDEEYEECLFRAKNKAQELADKISETFETQLNFCYNSDRLKEDFVEFYADSRLEGTEYIKDDSYELYEDISYVRSYN